MESNGETMRFADVIIGTIILCFFGGLISALLGLKTLNLILTVIGVAIFLGVSLIIAYHERKRYGSMKTDEDAVKP